MNKNIQIIIGIIAVILIGVVITISSRQKTNIEESAQTTDTSATSTPQSVSAYVQTGNVTVNGETTNGATGKVANISSVRTGNMSKSSVIVSWVTDLPVVTEIYYGDTPPAPNVAQQMIRDTKLKTVHAVELTSLSPGKPYYYTILSANAKEKIATTTVSGIFSAGNK